MHSTPTTAARHPSLTQRIVVWSLAAMVIIWASFVVLAYKVGIDEADELTDGHLASVATLLLDQPLQSPSISQAAPLQATVPWLKAHDYQYSISVIQWDRQGLVLSQSGSAPTPSFQTPVGFATLHLSSVVTPNSSAVAVTDWRSFTQWNTTRTQKIMVLLDLQERDDLAQDIASQMIIPGIWLLPVIALVLGLTIHRALQPLYALSKDVAQLDPINAQPLKQQHVWHEFASIVRSINTLLDRQKSAVIRERQLAHEIAHELRTPLASISLHASALQGTLSADEQIKTSSFILQDALRAGHVLQQLLTLAKTTQSALYETATNLDLASLVRSNCAEFAQTAWKRGCSITVNGPDQLTMQGHSVLIDIAIRNLLENALKHTPRDTQIGVNFGSLDNNQSWIEVFDDGGRTTISERTSTSSPSSNTDPAQNQDSLRLGHAIVSRIAEAHHGSFQTAKPPPNFTACYRVILQTIPAERIE
jgi:two-component system, OmpR family, sensor histidine kinase QseC